MAESPSSQDVERQNEEAETSNSEETKPASPAAGGKEQAGNDEASKKPSKLKELWAKTGLDMPTLIMMLKAAIPQTIGIAIYQAKDVADIYTTLGYLVAITSVLGFCIMPRSKFVQTMFINVIAVCIGAAVQLLAIWSSIQARYHTTPPGSPPQTYNSSASAVCAVWLFFQVYLVNSFRSARPQLQFPVIIYSIFVNVAMSFAPLFPNTAAGLSFIKRLLQAFLTGFSLSTAVSLFIFPITQRKIVFKEMAGYLQGLRGLLKAQIKYTASLEHVDMFHGKNDETKDHHKSKKASKKEERAETPEEKGLKAAVEGIKSLHSKLTADLVFAKREVAWGKLGPTELSKIFTLFRGIFLPLVGLPTLIDIFKRVAHIRGWDQPGAEVDEGEQKVVEEWQDIMKMLHSPFAEIGAAMDEGLLHVLIRFELINPPDPRASPRDEEFEPSYPPEPGSDKFAAWFESKTNAFFASRQVTLREWCHQKGIKLAADSFESDAHWAELAQGDIKGGPNRVQLQLFILLYIEYLIHEASKHLLILIQYADSKVYDRTLTRKKWISPGFKRVKKWFMSVLSADEDANEDSYVQSMDGAQDVYLGEAFNARKDPEHLPPQNTFEKIGNVIRQIPHMLRSTHSVFGFRVACATMSIGVIAYLERTYIFFIQQRLVWSMIMVAISMTRTSGQSLFNFVLRVFGTFCAMIASFLIYYIPDEQTAGIIVFLFIWETACFYIVIKKPQFVVVGIISAVTALLIVGYELQVRKIGVVKATSNGQPAYPIYLLAPYRLATVTGGLAVAWIWTIFPFPVTEHSELRKDLGSALYLAANFYAIVHETIGSRVRGDQGDPDDKNSPAHRLSAAGQKVFSKQLLLLDRIKLYSAFTRYELLLGGRFSREKYTKIIQLTEGIISYTALMSYASRSFAEGNDTVEGQVTADDWQRDFRQLLNKVAATSHDITTRLCLLSSAVQAGKPLPPYLSELTPFMLVQRLQEIDRDILSVRHIAEPGYAAFAVIQISARSILADLNSLTRCVKELVGELDFSFHIVSTAATSSASVDDDDAAWSKGKRD